ncbi:hypothetical protein HG536_0A08870 [Torulaspora globosa]|uniref:54S ribosomal protein IMG1, mitochondrial n=1 Tax=Torulaspora globosa TaxID=48254 RepID=A0A7G3ZC34_9SACH|nr:uncharacterized protein HG536_0A08870 [Torulaspora globosa]QLL31070.1 hypothetical protein HG536_0A08870 [Torulaspora globosa]
MLKSFAIGLGPRSFLRSYQIASTTRKTIPVYPPVEKAKKPNVVETLAKQDIETKLDPTGWRRELISKSTKNSLSAGDVVRVVYDSKKCSYDNFVGYVLAVNRKNLAQDASLLLRNQISKTAVEALIPVFSPLIERIDVLRRADSRRKRNRHYYIRNTKLDVGDLEASLRKKR